ncbi:phage/plasmid replication protein, II/X family [Paenibacillus sp. FSL L8-0696]|uniref:phage/plasmid replication protein, II/X family n=1 Tax=Paenibacillus sp. FSL L8-0696 TaxID=2954524 RepID=UPI00311A42E1
MNGVDVVAVDTVRLRSPYISHGLASKVEQECEKRMGINMRTGELLYEITTGSLEGSYDNRISIKVSYKEFKSSVVKGRTRTALVDCPPYIEIEASVHKLFLGHNVYGGTEDFQKACLYLIRTVEKLIGIELPGSTFLNGKQSYLSTWTVKRVDFAYIFNLGSMEAVQQFFYLFKNGYYPRRSVNTYGTESWVATASTTSTKAYHKGTEFRKHDMKRLIRAGVLTDNQAFDMLVLASEILRVEVEIKSRKLKYDFENTRKGREPYIMDITTEYLQSVYENEISRIMKEGKKKSDIVRDSSKVEERLNSMYSTSKANVLFSAYLKMMNFGIEKYKSTVTRPTFYRHLKQLREAGVSVNLNGEINLKDVTGQEESLLPEDFQPLRDDPRRMSGEDPQIDMLIAEMLADIKKDYRMATVAQLDSAIAIS